MDTKPTEVLVGRLVCGCVVAIRFSISDRREFEVAMEERGATVEVMPLKEANNLLKVCLHGVPNS